MSRIDELLEELCPEGVRTQQLAESGRFVRGNGMKKIDLRAEGIPAIHYGQIHTIYGVWEETTVSFVDASCAARFRKAKPGDLIIATTSEDNDSVAKATTWLGQEDVAVSGDAFIYSHSLNPKFVSYFFQSSMFQSQKRPFITGTKVRRISSESLGKIRIPVPPLPVQQEIVRILDKFTQLEAELEAELEARKQQYSYFRDALLRSESSCGFDWSNLGSIATRVSTGATPTAQTSDFYSNGTIPWLRTNEVRFNEIYNTEVKITDRALLKTGVSWIKQNCVIIAISGATAGRSAINKIPLTTNQHCCNLEIDPDQADFRYVFYWVSSNYAELRSKGRGPRADLNLKIIKDFPIPLPPLDEQRRIVEVLDKFDALVNDLTSGLPAEIEARRKQYEYYRDQLLTFKELPA